VRQMLNVAARCHLNGVVHRDMKPEVFAVPNTRFIYAIAYRKVSLYIFFLNLLIIVLSIDINDLFFLMA